MIDSNAFLGLPIQFKNICKVYPPKIKELLTETNYPVYKKVFLSTQEDIEDEYTEYKLPLDNVPNPIGYLFTLAAERMSYPGQF